MARWGMVIDLDKCTGCQACTVACWVENDVPHGSPEEQGQRREAYWNKVISVSTGEYPATRVEFIPMPCMHCDDAPCVIVCPVKATYHRDDGVVMQDYRRCIGCRYCIIACPYGARSFNFKKQEEKDYHRPDPPPDRADRGPWPFPRRVRGVVEKCTFCFHRIDQGIKEGLKIGVDVVPACVEACPARARSFGDLDDPGSEVSRLLASRGSFRLREELQTHPKVYYLHS
ncbi:MAG: 4Fe-4S dicluster domain-containing protein [Chloroflexi bacterium]|nr:4Fe-4S dicluster domain-containing protein [Chloroflexota bacterium]